MASAAFPYVARSVSYTVAVASTGPFDIPFRLFDATGSTLVVKVDGIATSAWSISADSMGADDPGQYQNAELTFDAAVTGTVEIYDDALPARPSQFQTGRGIPPVQHNAALNRIVAQLQNMQRLIGDVQDDIDDVASSGLPAGGIDDDDLNAATSARLIRVFDTVAAAAAYVPTTAPPAIMTMGYSAVGDGQGTFYAKVSSEPTHAFKFSLTRADAVVTWYEMVRTSFRHTPSGANTGPVAISAFGFSAPIRKRLRSRDGINTSNFGGTYWLSRAADLTGIADGKEGVFHAVLRFTGGDATNMTLLVNSTQRFKVFKGTDNKIRFLGYNSAGSLILDMRTNTAYTSASGSVILTAAWNLATGTTHIYVNGVADRAASPTATNDTIDYTATRWDVAADNGTQLLNADVGHLLFDDGFVDLSSARELRRFQTANGLCARMHGGRVYDSYDTKPLLFLTGNLRNITYNHGSAGNATPFTRPAGDPTNGSGVNGSLYKDLAAGDLQNNSPVVLTWDALEGVWVAPISLKETEYAQDYGATGTSETLTFPLNTTKIEIYGQGPGGGGGGGSTNHGGGGGGSGARGRFRFGWTAELGGVPMVFTTIAGVAGGAGNGAGNGSDGTTPSLATVDFPDTLGGVQLQFGAGQGGKGGTTTGGRGGRGGNIASTTVDQGGSDYWPDGISVSQFNLGSGFGETGFDTSGGEGGGEGDAGGGGGGGDATATGETSQGSYYQIIYTVEE